MAFAVSDRVRETTTTTGTGTLDLGGAVSGFKTFVSGIGDGNVTYYAIVHRTAAEFEIGIGTVNTIEQIVSEKKLSNPAIIILGEVVNHRQELQLVQSQVKTNIAV